LIIGIGHLTVGISRLLADADNWPIICFIKQNNKNVLTAVYIDDNEITNDIIWHR